MWREYFKRQKNEREAYKYSRLSGEIHGRKREEVEIALRKAQKMLGLSDEEVKQIKEEVREEVWQKSLKVFPE